MADNTKRANHLKEGEAPGPRWHQHWIWPLGLALAGIGSAAAFMLRGCWHTRMSWPLRYNDEFSYQACTSCGIKRLYDPKRFQAYGPYGYDIDELIARERGMRLRRIRQQQEQAEKRRRQASGQD
ncbi:MAG: hypothetical protein ACE14L_09350 [Terriglobales bacterium]